MDTATTAAGKSFSEPGTLDICHGPTPSSPTRPDAILRRRQSRSSAYNSRGYRHAATTGDDGAQSGTTCSTVHKTMRSSADKVAESGRSAAKPSPLSVRSSKSHRRLGTLCDGASLMANINKLISIKSSESRHISNTLSPDHQFPAPSRKGDIASKVPGVPVDEDHDTNNLRDARTPSNEKRDRDVPVPSLQPSGEESCSIRQSLLFDYDPPPLRHSSKSDGGISRCRGPPGIPSSTTCKPKPLSLPQITTSTADLRNTSVDSIFSSLSPISKQAQQQQTRLPDTSSVSNGLGRNGVKSGVASKNTWVSSYSLPSLPGQQTRVISTTPAPPPTPIYGAPNVSKSRNSDGGLCLQAAREPRHLGGLVAAYAKQLKSSCDSCHRAHMVSRDEQTIRWIRQTGKIYV
jgi:hypothetical protein